MREHSLRVFGPVNETSHCEPMSNVIPHYLWIIGIAVAGSRLAHAQAPATPTSVNEPFVITTWRTGQGLPQNWVECILQTRDGYLWLGTRLGLARFDGVEFTTYSGSNTREFEREFPKVLAEDADGNLWIGTKANLIVRRDGRFQAYAEADGLCHKEVTSIANSRDGGLWIGTRGGISRFVNETFTSYVNDGAEHKFVYSVCERRNRQVYAGFLSGLYRLHAQDGNFDKIWPRDGTKSLPPEINDEFLVNRIIEDQEENLWFATPYGLYCLESSGRLARYGVREGLDTEAVSDIHADRQGRIWAVTQHELHLFLGSRFEPMGLKKALSSDILRSVFQDAEGSLWVGTGLSGLVRLRSRILQTYTTRDGLSNNTTWGITQSQNGTVWIATDDKINFFRNGEFGVVRTEGPYTVNYRCAIEDRFGGLWLGLAWHGLLRLPEIGPPWAYSRTGTVCHQIQAVYEDRLQRVWIGTKESIACILPTPGSIDGRDRPGESWVYNEKSAIRAFNSEHWVFQYATGQWEHHASDIISHTLVSKCETRPFDSTSEDWVKSRISGKLTNYDVRGFLESRSGNLWIATADGGLNGIKDNQFFAYTVESGLISNSVWALHEDSDGALWIGTRHGLSRLKDGKFSNFSMDQGLFDNLINQLIEDDFGYFWIGCPRGIYRVSRSELNEVASGKRGAVTCIVFDESDGMLISQTNGQFQSAGCKTHDGKIWFPTNKGLVVVDPSKVHANQRPPVVHIEQFRANHKTIVTDAQVMAGSAMFAASRETLNGQPLHLPPGSAHLIEIRYTATSFAAPEKVQFKYRMHGYDHDWQEAGQRRFAYYTNLKPGRYRFHVIACNNHGIWNETGASFAFTIAPHFWETLSFQALCWLSSVGLVGGIIFYRRRSQQAKAINEERARIARDLHDDLGAGLTRIQLLGQRAFAEPSAARGAAERITEDSAAMMGKLDELLWVTNPRFDTLDALAAHLRELAGRTLLDSGTSLSLDFAIHIPPRPVSAGLRRELCLVLIEALNNILKHAGASDVRICFQIRPRPHALWTRSRETLELSITDNGCGFDPEKPRRHRQPTRGNGLVNLRARMEAVGGSIEVQSAHGQGTQLTARVPVIG